MCLCSFHCRVWPFSRISPSRRPSAASLCLHRPRPDSFLFVWWWWRVYPSRPFSPLPPCGSSAVYPRRSLSHLKYVAWRGAVHLHAVLPRPPSPFRLQLPSLSASPLASPVPASCAGVLRRCALLLTHFFAGSCGGYRCLSVCLSVGFYCCFCRVVHLRGRDL